MPPLSAPASRLAELSPANFAIVMATGIVGFAAHQHGHRPLALFLLACCAVAWPLIAILMLARLVLHRGRFFDDLRSHRAAPGFFTAVAGTCVLGSQMMALGFGTGASSVLAAIGAVLWVVLTYAILLALTVREDKPALGEAITGAWLLVVVATQSLAVLTVLLAAQAPQPTRLALNFCALALWLAGGMLYVWLIALIFYRFLFLRLSTQELVPTYWINMGAMAISALAGGLLVHHAADAPFLQSLLPFLKGGTVLYWAVGTWWIPLLVAFGFWRYVVRRHPMRYDVAYWGVVFPLGMYSAATKVLATVLALRFLAPIAQAFFYLAMGAWLLTTLGLARHLGRALQRPVQQALAD